MKFKQSPRSLALKSVLDTIRRDPVLQREVKHWSYGEGDRSDTQVDASTRTRPFVRLTPVPGTTTIGTNHALRTNLDIMVEFSISGTSYYDALDLWGQFESVMASNQTKYQAAGAMIVVPMLQTIEVNRSDSSILGRGVLRIDMFFPFD